MTADAPPDFSRYLLQSNLGDHDSVVRLRGRRAEPLWLKILATLGLLALVSVQFFRSRLPGHDAIWLRRLGDWGLDLGFLGSWLLWAAAGRLWLDFDPARKIVSIVRSRFVVLSKADTIRFEEIKAIDLRNAPQDNPRLVLTTNGGRELQLGSFEQGLGAPAEILHALRVIVSSEDQPSPLQDRFDGSPA